MRRPRAQLHLDIRFSGSVDAIGALNEGRCVVAGFHTPTDPPLGSLAQRTYQPLLQARAAQAHRLRAPQPGPDGGAGQPPGPGFDGRSGRGRGALRQPGTGHRHAGAVRRTAGARRDWRWPTSRATATRSPRTRPWRTPWPACAPTRAWASKPRRAARGLDFVPLLREDYYLVCLKAALDEPSRPGLARGPAQQRLAIAGGGIARVSSPAPPDRSSACAGSCPGGTFPAARPEQAPASRAGTSSSCAIFHVADHARRHSRAGTFHTPNRSRPAARTTYLEGLPY